PGRAIRDGSSAMWTAASTRTARRVATSTVVLLAGLVPSSSVAGPNKAPNAPSGLTASATTTSVSLSWKSRAGIAGYDVYLTGAQVGSTQSTSHTFGSLGCGTSYSLGVDAYDTKGTRSRIASLSASTSSCPGPAPDTTPPTAPTLLTETAPT